MRNEKILEGLGVEDLVKEFNLTKSDECFEILWNKIKAFAIKVGSKYVTIPYEEKESIAMEVLFRCLPKLENKKGKLLTYYGFALKGEYICYLEKMNRKKELIIKDSVSLDEMKEEINYEPTDNKDNFDVDFFSYQSKLDRIETLLVKMIYGGYKRDEIREKLKLTSEKYNSVMRGLREKIQLNYIEG